MLALRDPWTRADNVGAVTLEAAPATASLLEGLRERFPRVAVVHDWLTIPGGSEQVVLELLEIDAAAYQ